MRLVNAFSANMLPEGMDVAVHFRFLTLAEAQDYDGEWTSAVGHADTARLFSGLLGREVAVNRETLTVAVGDRLLLGQYRGPRLPEGAATLPEGASVAWYLVDVG